MTAVNEAINSQLAASQSLLLDQLPAHIVRAVLDRMSGAASRPVQRVRSTSPPPGHVGPHDSYNKPPLSLVRIPGQQGDHPIIAQAGEGLHTATSKPFLPPAVVSQGKGCPGASQTASDAKLMISTTDGGRGLSKQQMRRGLSYNPADTGLPTTVHSPGGRVQDPDLQGDTALRRRGSWALTSGVMQAALSTRQLPWLSSNSVQSLWSNQQQVPDAQSGSIMSAPTAAAQQSSSLQDDLAADIMASNHECVTIYYRQASSSAAMDSLLQMSPDIVHSELNSKAAAITKTSPATFAHPCCNHIRSDICGFSTWAGKVEPAKVCRICTHWLSAYWQGWTPLAYVTSDMLGLCLRRRCFRP